MVVWIADDFVIYGIHLVYRANRCSHHGDGGGESTQIRFGCSLFHVLLGHCASGEANRRLARQPDA